MNRSPRILAMVGAFLLGAAVVASSAVAFDYKPLLQSLQAPPEVRITLAAGEPAVRFPMFACFDEDGRLYVAESSGKDLYAGLQKLTRDCRISCLEDLDHDGRFEKSTVFQEGLTFPMGLVWREGKLYVADPPHLVTLTDTNRDGIADTRDIVLSGFGHTDNGSLHGLTFGPDGLLYFTMGEPDGWKLPRGNGTYLEGNAGALFRARPDGSHPEVISRGFINLVEVEFLAGGEIIGTDNWYQKPAGGYRDALIDCAPGGLYPFAEDRGTPLPRTGVILPPLILRPAVAHSGLTRLRGSGFPEPWRGNLIVAEHNTRKVVRYRLERDGSTFAATNIDLVVGEHPDFHPADVLEDADGSLLVVDTGGWYVEHCPTGRIRNSRAPGGIYRVMGRPPLAVQDPRGTTLAWDGVVNAVLAERMRDGRFAVAERAQQMLVQRRATSSLAPFLHEGELIETRLRALWGLARIGDSAALEVVRKALHDHDPILVTAAARAVARQKDAQAGPKLVELLRSTNAPVRRAAAEGLIAWADRTALSNLVDTLVVARDDFEKHTCIAALQTIVSETDLRGFLSHPSPRVQAAALILLDQPPVEALRFVDLVEPLGADDLELRNTARRLLERHRGWSADALPWLRVQLVSLGSARDQQATIENLLVSFQSDQKVRQLISESLGANASLPEPARVALLQILPFLTNRRPEEEWLHAIRAGLTNRMLRPAALRAALAFPGPAAEKLLLDLAEDPAVVESERLVAVRASSAQPALSKTVFGLVMKALEPDAAAAHRLSAVDLLGRAQLSAAQLRDLLRVLAATRTVAPDSLVAVFRRSADAQTRPLLADFFKQRLAAGWTPASGIFDRALDIFEADAPVRATLTDLWQRNRAGALRRLTDFQPLLAGGRPDQGQVLFVSGTCSGCHRVGSVGGTVGPDLTRIGAIRSGVDLLESILYPSSSFAQGYEAYQLTRRDGEELSGSLVAQDSDAVQLRDGAGVVHRIRAQEIRSLTRQELSAMPEGLEQLLTREQFRDLLAYLQGLR